MTQAPSHSENQPNSGFSAAETGDGEIARILRQRAELIATPQNDMLKRTAAITALTVQSAGESYALPMEKLGSVFPFRNCAWVPGTDAALLGVTSDRGELVGVYDFRRLLGLSGAGIEKPALAINLHHPTRRAAIAVSEIVGVTEVAVDTLSSLDRDKGGSAKLFRGVAPTGLILLDMEAINDRINQSGDLK